MAFSCIYDLKWTSGQVKQTSIKLKQSVLTLTFLCLKDTNRTLHVKKDFVTFINTTFIYFENQTLKMTSKWYYPDYVKTELLHQYI